MYFKQCHSAPTNSISCGRPLPNIPLLYSVPSLSLCYYYTFILIPCVPSLFSLILICTSHLFFLSSLPTLRFVFTSLCSSRPRKTIITNNCDSVPQSFTIMLSHAREIPNVSFFHTGLIHSGVFSRKVRSIDFGDL